MSKRIGKQTVELINRPKIISTGTVVGPKEGEGPLSKYFDVILEDDKNGQETFEKAESSLVTIAVNKALEKANLKNTDIHYIFAGDLLNQLSASTFALRGLEIPFIGLYGACSTMALSLSMAAMNVDGEFSDYSIAATSSHFSTAERQFRMPLEYGGQKKVTSQWTVTASGAAIVSSKGGENYPQITHVTTGKIMDYGITDANNMGAAMAPAAVDTIKQHLRDTGRTPDYYDVIATGDLGSYGMELTKKLLLEYGYDVSKVYIDCGVEIFKENNGEKSNPDKCADKCLDGVMCGGSGCGCSASVFCGYLYKSLLSGKFKKVLLVSTGALLSTTTSLQGESIPGIAHAVAIEFGGAKC